MSALTIENLDISYGDSRVTHGIGFTVAEGESFALVGESGSGKTTVLKAIAGMARSWTGSIAVFGRPRSHGIDREFARQCQMVFQDPYGSLHPRKTVDATLSEPLTIHGISDNGERVDEVMQSVGLDRRFRFRFPHQLSGGQRQRVAIARALALSPKLFLLDEPLSALDAKLREAMQVELRQLQQRLGITTFVVTHDQREAMTMADLVVVMGHGKILQAASPIEIYRKPADAFVADFIGMTNLLDATADRAGRVSVLGQAIPGLAMPEGVTKAAVSIRPEDVHLVPVGGDTITGTVTFVRDLGGTIETFVEAGGKTIIAVATPRERPNVVAGQQVGISLPAEACVVLKS